MKLKYYVMATAVLFLASCGSKDKTAESASDDVAEVKVASVSAQDIPQTEEYSATVESDKKNNISPNTPLRIKTILVDVGDWVHAGQVVAYLDNTTQSTLDLQIQSQQATIKSQEAQLKNQETETNRTKQLYAAGGTSKSDLDAAETQLRVQQLALEAQKAQLRVLKGQSAQSGANNKLVSPVNGVVTARNYDNGDMYGSLPVLTVEETNHVKVLVNVSENYYKLVKKGQSVDITLDAYEGEHFHGTITIVYPSIDVNTHTFPVEITIDNSAQKVRPGMFARATLDFGSQRHVLIPDEALVKQIGAGDRYVYVYHPDTKTVSYNKVELGKHIESKYEIISGVASGDQVVTAGQSRLNNGKKVKVVK